jgi:hypothetical protein
MTILAPEKTKSELWNDFMRDLTPWQLHRLMHNELEYHDAYMDDTMTLMKVYGLVIDGCTCLSCLTIAGNEPRQQSVRV